MDLYDVLFAKSLSGNGGGGGGNNPFTLLKTADLGHITNTGTETTVGTVVVKGVNPYDVLFVITKAAAIEYNKNIMTVDTIFQWGTSDINTKNNKDNLTSKLAFYMSDSGQNKMRSTRAGTYGIYCTSSFTDDDDRTATLTMIARKGSATGTIDGDYTTYVYGVKFMDLFAE